MPLNDDDALFRRMVEQAPDAKLVVGLDGRVLFANLEAERMWRRSRDEIVGSDVGGLVPERLHADLRAWAEGYLPEPYQRAMGAEELGLAVLAADGREVPVDVSLSPVRRGDELVVAVAVRDLTERHGAQTLFRDLLESAPDAMVIADEDGRIVLVNAAVERMFGWDRDDLVGEPVEMLVPTRFHPAHRRHREGFVADARPRAMGVGEQLVAQRKDGESFAVDVSLAPLATPDGILVCAAVRDVDERLRARGETERMREELIATVSHELRTPLTSIIGYTELLTEMGDELGPQARKLLAVIDRNASRELTLVNDLLTLAALHTEQLSVVRRPVDLAAIVRGAAETSAPLLRDAGLTLRLDIGPVTPASGDPDRLVQVLDNLLGNAMKFTERGGEVCLRVRDDGERVLLEVSDTGVGMHPHEARLAWERLYRAPGAINAQVQGAGLGLSIVRAIVEAHEGTAELTSEPDVGTAVRIWIPT